MASEFEIVVGTYEQFMLGYKVERTTDAKYAIKQTFATRSHTGSIRAVAASDRFLASAGCDDRVFVYDMNSRKEIQMLMHHKGTVNTVAFTPQASHLMTGSADGSISVVRTGNWQIEKLWGSAHKQLSVNNIAVHPSGKMALSVGSDYVLRTWNLVKGRKAYATNLASRGVHGRFADAIHFSPTGILFTITGSKILEIWSISNAEVTDSLEFDSKVVSATWISDNKLVCGLEDGNMSIYETELKQNKVIKAHEGRVKCIAATKGYIITCDSSGVIKLWSNYDDEDVSEISSTNASCRITCITLIDNNCLKKEKIDEKVDVELEEQVRNSDSDEEISKEVVPAIRPRREVVIVEEEVNEIKIPLGNKKKNKKRQLDSVDNNVSPSKQKKTDGAFVKMNKSNLETEMKSEALHGQNSKKKTKLKRKIAEDVAEENDEINNEIAVDNKKIKKKSKKNKSDLEVVEDFIPADIEVIENKKSKKEKSSKLKEGSNNLELMESTKEIVQKESKKQKSKKSNVDSGNLKLVENAIGGKKSKKLKKNKISSNNSEPVTDDVVIEAHMIENKKSKKEKSNRNSELELVENVIENKKSKKSKKNKNVLNNSEHVEDVSITEEKSKMNKDLKNIQEPNDMVNRKTKKEKTKRSVDFNLHVEEVTDEIKVGKKKSKKNKVMEDLGIDSTDADLNQTEKSKNVKKNKKNQNKPIFKKTDPSNRNGQKFGGANNKKKTKV